MRRRLVLGIVDHAVVASLGAQTSRISLYDIERLSYNGPRRKPKSDAELLAACHEHLHGASCQSKGCAMSVGEERRRMLRSFWNARRSAQRASARISGAAAMQRSASIIFDFAKGSCEFEAGQPPALRSDATDAVWTPSTPSATSTPVASTLSLPSLVPNLRVGGKEALNRGREGVTAREDAAECAAAERAERPVHVRLQGVGVTTPRTALMQRAAKAEATAAPEVCARLSVETGQVRLRLRVGGCEALLFGAVCSGHPRRQSALAAAASRARSEQELDAAADAAEADEAERRLSWQLAQQLAAERAAKEEAVRRAAAAEEAVRAQADARAAAERAASERAAKQQAVRQAALAREREQTGEWRRRAATFEEELYALRRQPDEQLRSANARVMAARARAEREAHQQQAENARLASARARMSCALERERAERRAAEAALAEADERRVADLRQQAARSLALSRVGVQSAPCS